MSVVEQVEQIEQISGNIQTEIFTQEDKGFQANKFFFTYHLNQHPEFGVEQKDTFENAFKKLEGLKPLCDKFIWGEEYGNKGNTPHLQGCFILKAKMRWKTIEKNFFSLPCPYGKKLKNWGQASSYCAKECNQIHYGGFEFEKPLKKLACEGNFKIWQKYTIDILDSEPDDRTINWFLGSGGLGKTTFCKWIYRNYKNVIMLSGKSADMKNGIVEFKKTNGLLPEIILINLPRSFNKEYLSYTGIEEIKDMFFYSGKYEGGMVDGNPPHLFIFSNEKPDTTKLSIDRWNIRNLDEMECGIPS